MVARLLVLSITATSNYILDHFRPHFTDEFIGQAKGGLLSLVQDDWGNGYTICSVKTAPGGSGAEVVKRLVEALRASSNPTWQIAVCEGSSLYLPDSGEHYIVGSDTGFTTRRPPRFVTINYFPTDDQVTANWIPDEQVAGECVGVSGSMRKIVPALDGSVSFDNISTKRRRDSRIDAELKPDPKDLAFCVRKMSPVGKANSDLSSRFIRIHVSGALQEDLDNLPFYGNVQPNWESWCMTGFEEGQATLYQGEKSEVPEKERKLAYASSPDTKVYCQMFEIKDGVPAEGGVYRRYLGLLPGHTYRAYARFNTFEAKADAGDWSLSFHACADPPGQGLTVDQLAGKKPLPNNSVGPDAGCIALFKNGGQTTEGRWARVSTGMAGGLPSGRDITIPEGSTSLSAWVRVKGSSASRFGMDWSALEDVTPTR